MKRVRVLDAYDLKAIEAYLWESLPLDEPSVLIARSPCVLLRRGEQSAPFRVDPEKCVACGACLKTGCPALLPLPDGKVGIESSICTGCSVCARVCPVGAIGPG